MKIRKIALLTLGAAALLYPKKDEIRKKVKKLYRKEKVRLLEGNAWKYSLEEDQKTGDCLKGKTIAYLGSSVTYGAASQGTSFVEYIAKHTGSSFVKEAVSGTTLADDDEISYVSRFVRIPEDEKVDLFVLQLSTNDATKNKPLGEIREERPYDTHTVTGAIQEIMARVKKTWDCPVLLYTNAYYESEAYAKMVERAMELADRTDLILLDLYHDAELNAVTEEERKLYMADPIHPTKAGYQLWWTPVMEEKIREILS